MSTDNAITPIAERAPAQWMARRAEFASSELSDCIERNPQKLGGVPVIKGTRISVAQILAELAEGLSIEEVAQDFNLDLALVKRMVSGLSACLDRPLSQ